VFGDFEKPLVVHAFTINGGHVVRVGCVAHDVIHGRLVATFAANRFKGMAQSVEAQAGAVKTECLQQLGKLFANGAAT